MTKNSLYGVRLSVLVAVVLAASVLALVKPAEAAFPGLNGKIVFRGHDFEGDDEIFKMNPDGTELEQLTHNDEYDGEPVFSASGRKIAFVSARDGNFEVYRMDADGTDQTNLTNADGEDDMPAWSPNGRKIVFMHVEAGSGGKIYTMNANGEYQTSRDEAMSGAEPDWGSYFPIIPPF